MPWEKLNWAVTSKLPFPGAAPPFGSKSESEDEEADSECAEAQFSWGTFANDALPDTMTSDPGEHDEAVDHSKDGEARDTSTAGFAAATRLIAAQPGITSPVQNLPKAPPGAAEKAKERSKHGRGIEGGGDTAIDPMSTMDKFNWDNMPLPGLGQI